MLAFLGLAMVVVFTFLIMTKRLSPIVALTVVPIVFAVIGGFGGTTGKMMLDGLKWSHRLPRCCCLPSCSSA